MKAMLVAMMVLGLSTGLAQAKNLHHHQHYSNHHRYARVHHHKGYERGELASHPIGCPWHNFCGCGVSVRVFGRIVGDLKLAWNWARKFPHASPAPGMVAVWRHHVAYIESMDASGAVVYDPNSGGHGTRIHHRSLAGAVIVNPRG